MSEGVRKNLRTQGKYSDDRVQKNRDKKQKSSISAKDTSEIRYPKRNSGGTKGINSSLSDEGPSPLRYEEKSDYTFQELEEVAKPEEIKGRVKMVLSKTENGESIIYYEPAFLHEEEGDEYFYNLYETINWDARNIVIHGVEYPQPRLVAWFGPFEYKYSGTTLEPAEMPDVVLEIKEKVEMLLKSQQIEASFNSVLINLYRDGKDSVAWHSDDELMLGISPTIASVSLGETRKFQMRPKMRNHDGHSPSDNPTKYFVHLTHGSLIVMTGSMQDDWQHRVPKEYHDRAPRINLTFRTVYPLEEAPEKAAGKGIHPKNVLKQPNEYNSSSKFSDSKYKLDEENFPSLQKDAVSAKSNTKYDFNDNPKSNHKKEDTHEELWDSEISDIEQNVDDVVAHNNAYPIVDRKDEDFKSKNYEKSHFDNERKTEKWHSIEPYSGNEKNSLDDKTATKKLWQDDSVSSFQEGNANKYRVEKSYNTHYSKSVPNLTANEGNKFHKKINSRKNYEREANLTGKGYKQNNTSHEERSVKSFTKTNSRRNFIEENNVENQEPPKYGYASESKSWADVSEECSSGVQTVNMPLNMDAEAFTNSFITQENNPVEIKQPQSRFHYVENHSHVTEENTLGAKMTLNVDAKEFVPSNIKSNEFILPCNVKSDNEFSESNLEDLLNYEVNALEGKDLQDHVKYLKIRIAEKLENMYRDRRHDLSRHDRRDLEFLMEISDGSQNDKNQRLISRQMCRFVQSKLQSYPSSWNGPQSFSRSSRPHNYDRNFHSDRRKIFPNQNRNFRQNHSQF